MPQEVILEPTKRWHPLLGIIGALIVLRIFLAPWFWPLATAIGIIWGWDYLRRQFPDHKRLVSMIMVVVTVLATGPYLYEFVSPYNERSVDAGKRRLLSWDMWRAKKIDPPMLKSRNELSDQSQWLQDQIGAQHSQIMARIRADRNSGRITMAQALEQTMAVQNETERYQKQIADISSRVTSDSTPQQQSTMAPRVFRILINPNTYSKQVGNQIPFGAKWSFASPGTWAKFKFENGEELDATTLGQRPKAPTHYFQVKGDGRFVEITVH